VTAELVDNFVWRAYLGGRESPMEYDLQCGPYKSNGK
jgi:hypothetical protein